MTQSFSSPTHLRSASTNTSGAGFSTQTAGFFALALLTFGSGCSRFKAKPAEQYVYVTAKSANLRDRVAAVSNRTGSVSNGDRLKILDHGRHFLKVQSEKGEIGWIEEKAVATGAAAGEFDVLKEQHKGDPEVASAVVRDAVYMHLKPGRDTERFYLLAEGEKLKLLKRATLIKVVNPALVARAQRPIPQAAGSDAKRKDAPAPAKASPAEPPAPPSMEDWWLVRDSQGHTGWVFARMMDVDAPDALTRYAEGQRFVGAYVLTHVHDDGAPGDNKEVPIYVTVLSPYKAGLPYDFDQIRVFTWSTSKHRYETGFREKNIEGYLPVTVGRMKDPSGKSATASMDLPSFTYKLLPADAPAVTPDPDTGVMLPSRTITRTYRMEGNFMHRMVQPGAPLEAEAHPVAEEKKARKGRGRR